MKAWLVSTLGVWIYRLLAMTWRRTFIEPPSLQEARKNGQAVLLAHWHGDELGLISVLKHYRACAMISTSKDGEIMNRVVLSLGGMTSRGSSTRGGTMALRGLLKNVRDGYNPSVAVDGPKGPIYKAKPGIFEISKLLSIDIYPIVVAASAQWVFSRAWNKAILPKPFARVTFYCGEPMRALEKIDDPRDEQFAKNLEDQIHNAKRQAERHIIAGSTSPC